MQIFVRHDRKSLSLRVDPSSTVTSVKKAITASVNISPDAQVLSFGGKNLVDGRTLADYGVESESTLDLSLRLLGGHCQVPCGIFDDPKTVAEVKEACATIRKAMVQINELAKAGSAQAFNQMTRWVMTKEEHCKNIITTISEYCLCQRVKSPSAAKSPFKTQKDYIDALLAHHNVMVAAMKAKQTVDIKGADALEHAVGDWSKMYLPEESKSSSL